MSADSVAVSASGGLLSMGHPIGPTGVGQICELATQLRGEGGARQPRTPDSVSRTWSAMGAVCVRPHARPRRDVPTPDVSSPDIPGRRSA